MIPETCPYASYTTSVVENKTSEPTSPTGFSDVNTDVHGSSSLTSLQPEEPSQDTLSIWDAVQSWFRG